MLKTQVGVLVLVALLGATVACDSNDDDVEWKFVSDPDGDGGVVVVVNDPPELNDSGAGDTLTRSQRPSATKPTGPALSAPNAELPAELPTALGPETRQLRREGLLALSQIYVGDGQLAQLVLRPDGLYDGFVFDGLAIDGRLGDARLGEGLDETSGASLTGRWQRDVDSLLFTPDHDETSPAVKFGRATATWSAGVLIFETPDARHVLHRRDVNAWPLSASFP